jgi:hypothetical protein
MTGTVSPIIRSSSCGSPAVSVRGKDRTGWRGWRRNSGKRGTSSCGVYLPDLEQPRPPDDPPGRPKLRLINNP